MKVCVYCASSPNIDKVYFRATRKLATYLVDEGIEVVYGGGATGLMGQLADGILEEGGKIKGIMPQFMNEVEWGHKMVEDFEYTETMHERKAKFLVGIDGLITLPGGTGTFEELLEAITLKRLGIYNKPIVILNTANYYAPLKEMLERSVEQKFMQEKHLDMWVFVDEPEDVVPALKAMPEWNGGAIGRDRFK
jgi:uncharacterized protein (TIGR00730 family)